MYKTGDTITIKATGKQALIMDVPTMGGMTAGVFVSTKRNSVPTYYPLGEIELYQVQSPDVVGLLDDRGQLWFYEVLDVSANGLEVYLKGDDGQYWTCPIREITRIIPASVAAYLNWSRP